MTMLTSLKALLFPTAAPGAAQATLAPMDGAHDFAQLLGAAQATPPAQSLPAAASVAVAAPASAMAPAAEAPDAFAPPASGVVPAASDADQIGMQAQAPAGLSPVQPHFAQAPAAQATPESTAPVADSMKGDVHTVAPATPSSAMPSQPASASIAIDMPAPAAPSMSAPAADQAAPPVSATLGEPAVVEADMPALVDPAAKIAPPAPQIALPADPQPDVLIRPATPEAAAPLPVAAAGNAPLPVAQTEIETVIAPIADEDAISADTEDSEDRPASAEADAPILTPSLTMPVATPIPTTVPMPVAPAPAAPRAASFVTAPVAPQDVALRNATIDPTATAPQLASPDGAPPVAGTPGQGDAAPVLAQVAPDPASRQVPVNGGTANLSPVAAAPAEGAEILSRADAALADPASAPLAAPAMPAGSVAPRKAATRPADASAQLPPQDGDNVAPVLTGQAPANPSAAPAPELQPSPTLAPAPTSDPDAPVISIDPAAVQPAARDAMRPSIAPAPAALSASNDAMAPASPTIPATPVQAGDPVASPRIAPAPAVGASSASADQVSPEIAAAATTLDPRMGQTAPPSDIPIPLAPVVPDAVAADTQPLLAGESPDVGVPPARMAAAPVADDQSQGPDRAPATAPVPEAPAARDLASARAPAAPLPQATADLPPAPTATPEAEVPLSEDGQTDPLAAQADGAAEGARPMVRRARAEAVSLLQLVREQMAGRPAQRTEKGADGAATPATDSAPAATTAASTQASAAAAPMFTAAPQAAAPVVTAAAMPTIDLSASLGAQVVDMGVSGQWIDGLARDLAGLTANGAQGRFQINADQLGPVQVDIRQGADGAAVSLTVASEAAELALRQDSDMLKLDSGLSPMRISEVKVERAPHITEPARSDGASNQNGSQSDHPQQQAAGQWQGQGQSAGQSQMQGRQGRENIAMLHKNGGEAVVMDSEEAGDGVRDTVRARYA